MSCSIGIHNAISKILNNKPWFGYISGDEIINILDSPLKKINKQNSIGIANTVANAINKSINNGYKNIGDIVFADFNSNGRGIIRINPSVNQLNLINSQNEKEFFDLQKEIQEEKRKEDFDNIAKEGNVYLNEENEIVSEDDLNYSPQTYYSENPQDQSTNEVAKEILSKGGQLKEINKPESIPADNQLSLNLTEEETNNQNLTLRVIDILETKEADFAFSEGLNNNNLNKILETLKIPKSQINAIMENMSKSEIEPIKDKDITYTNEEGLPCAEAGLKSSNFTKGGKWEIIKVLKGPAHAQGGIDIEIGNGGVKLSNKQGEFKAKDGLILPAYLKDKFNDVKEGVSSTINSVSNKIEEIKGTKLNPKNWGVTDYSDKGDFNTAYSTARKADEKEFLFKDKRYSTTMKPVAGDVVQKREDFEGNFMSKTSLQDRDKWYKGEKLSSFYEYFAGLPLTDRALMYSKYKPQNSKDKNKMYIGINDEKLKQDLWEKANYAFDPETREKVFGKDRINIIDENNVNFISHSALGHSKFSRGKDDRGDYYSIYDVFDVGTGKGFLGSNIGETLGANKSYEIYDRMYYKDYNGTKKRMYYTDKELSELNIDKKDFDTLGLQRELSNRGYELSKSTKQDGSLDGIWGDETKNALLQFQNKSK
jgi:hypothetical protein